LPDRDIRIAASRGCHFDRYDYHRPLKRETAVTDLSWSFAQAKVRLVERDHVFN